MSPPRIAVVTGASQGIGLETCMQLAGRGLHVVLTARREDALDDGLAALGRSHAIEGRALDPSDEGSVDAFFGWLAGRHGRLDVLVNNAARLYTHRGPAEETPAALVAEAIDNNALSAWRMIRKALPLMRANGYGRIVNVSSGMGALDGMGGGSIPYRISKTALNAVTRVAHNLAGGDLKVNAVCPGWVRTKMGGASATRDVEEAAGGIVWAATLPAGGPSGGFFRDGKPIGW